MKQSLHSSSVEPAPGKAERARVTAQEALADYLLTHGLEGASLRPMAAAAGISDRMLIYYFGDKDSAIGAALLHAAARLALELAGLDAQPTTPAELYDALVILVTAPRFAPFMTLWLEIAARAARGEALYRQIGGQIATGFLDWIAQRLTGEAEARAEEARRLLSRLEGEIVLRSVGA